MEFKKYQHIERFGTDETEGIEYGQCYIFPYKWIDIDFSLLGLNFTFMIFKRLKK